MTLAKRVWFLTAVALLAVGVAAALLDYLPNDTGLGVLWYLAVGALSLPFGTVFYVAALILLGVVEHALPGPEIHFVPLAQVCLLWAAAVAGGLLQSATFRRWHTWRRRQRGAI